MSLLFLLSYAHLWAQTFLCRVEAMVFSLLSWLYGHLTLVVTQGSIFIGSYTCIYVLPYYIFKIIFNKILTFSFFMDPANYVARPTFLYHISLPSAFWGCLTISGLLRTPLFILQRHKRLIHRKYIMSFSRDLGQEKMDGSGCQCTIFIQPYWNASKM